MIKIASHKDIPRILEITQACANHMIFQGIYQWNSHYPNKAAFENDLLNNELYVILCENSLIGCVVITSKMSIYYNTVEWLDPHNNAIYVHRLAVHPNFQGKGFAQKLMDFAENYAKVHQFHSVRLDTFSKNARNQKFYELRGYQKLGDIYFPKQSEFPFYCYELLL